LKPFLIRFGPTPPRAYGDPVLDRVVESSRGRGTADPSTPRSVSGSGKETTMSGTNDHLIPRARVLQMLPVRPHCRL